MSTVYLDTEKIHTSREAYDYLKEQQIKEGDEIRILTGEDTGTLAFVGIIVLVILAIVAYFDKNQQKAFGNKIIDQLFGGKSSEEIEKAIEAQYGVHIEVEQKDTSGNEWKQLAAKGLANTYDEEEPDYSDVELKEKNPNYKGPAQI